ncbi:MAG: hypothetical protein GEV07_07760 [Streptosporangiales bacterium]|nr:hypothetical protein [Streptosporangiales bacterium]
MSPHPHRSRLSSALSAFGSGVTAAAAAMLGVSGEVAEAQLPAAAAAVGVVVVLMAVHAWLPGRQGVAVAATSALGCLGFGGVAVWLTGPAGAGAPATVQSEIVPWSLGLAAAGIAAIVAGAASRVRAGAPASRPRLVSAAGAVVGVALAVALTVVAVPWQAAAHNTTATTAEAAVPPRTRPPELTGHVGWQGRYVASGVAGPVLATEHGIGVVDRRTGALRWSYQRWDRTYAGVTAAGVAATTPDRRVLAVVSSRDDADAQVQVFDAVTGERTRAWRTDYDRIVTATEDRVLMTRESDSAAIATFTLDGDLVWQRNLAAHCTPDATLLARWQTTVALQCGSHDGLTGYDVRTGKVRWRYQPHDDYRTVAAPLADQRGPYLVVHEEYHDEPTRRVRALRVTDGRQAWRWSARQPVSVAVGGGLTVTGVRTKSHGWGEPAATEFTARSTSTGKVRWRHTSTRDHVLATGPARRLSPPTFTVLADDRVVFAYRSAGTRGRNCAFEVLARDGRPVRTFRPRGDLREETACAFNFVPAPDALVVNPYDSDYGTAFD